jgi:hypothetical protein
VKNSDLLIPSFTACSEAWRNVLSGIEMTVFVLPVQLGITSRAPEDRRRL